MKKGIFAMFILVASMAMVACTGANKSTTNEGAVGENDAFKALEKRREYYKAQDKERAKLEAEAKKAEEKAMKEAVNKVETTTEQVVTEEAVTVDEAEARKAEEKAMEEAAKAKAAAEKEALKILEKKRKSN